MGVAHAAEVYQGDDVSYGTDANRRVVVCDNESDGHGVHSDFYSFAGASWRVDDLDGMGGYCWESNQVSSGVAKHRTVEEVNNWPDYKSAWSYH
ncbi:MAG: hypothetical protein H0V07_09605 [Propionibacteriales bacterium]|nr:hypothetical protein [Propionibacteriales bacterium]